jgi:hypothetical protein
MVMPGVLGSLLQILIFMYGKERGKKGVVLIWLVALRSIWLARKGKMEFQVFSMNG